MTLRHSSRRTNITNRTRSGSDLTPPQIAFLVPRWSHISTPLVWHNCRLLHTLHSVDAFQSISIPEKKLPSRECLRIAFQGITEGKTKGACGPEFLWFPLRQQVDYNIACSTRVALSVRGDATLSSRKIPRSNDAAGRERECWLSSGNLRILCTGISLAWWRWRIFLFINGIHYCSQ